ncbi:MAG: lipoprotein [Leptospira sp.]|nr:lipoprotein [Leptospira sp.]
MKRRRYPMIWSKCIMVVFCVLLFPNCGITKIFRSSGSLQVTAVRQDSKKILAIGIIENRDARFSPFLIKNFSDMLQFHLIDLGFQFIEIDSEVLQREVSGSKQAEFTPEKEPAKSAVINENNIPVQNAIDKADPETGKTSQEKILSSEQIRKLAEKINFNFFIQGAIGNNESGTLLESDENSLIFLKIYNSEGKLVNAVNFTVNGRNIAEAPFLRDVCSRISGKLAKGIK